MYSFGLAFFFIAIKNPPRLSVQKLGYAEPPIGVKGKMVVALFIGFLTASAQTSALRQKCQRRFCFLFS